MLCIGIMKQSLSKVDNEIGSVLVIPLALVPVVPLVLFPNVTRKTHTYIVIIDADYRVEALSNK